jgi:demethylmenaquinone methyltransferase/2-methoxy-6-polyprenyl-1,4-benzoquinol methylase
LKCDFKLIAEIELRQSLNDFPTKKFMTGPESSAIHSMFGRIARRYDLANRVLSFGLDRGRRKKLVASVRRKAPRDVLDLATGSGDVAFALSAGLPRETRITGMDFCEPMLAEARKKMAAAGPGACANLRFEYGDGLALPLPDKSFDAVTISFGLRNMTNRALSLAEMRRVLRPGGTLFVLEFSHPHAWFKPVYFFYLRHVLPMIAGCLTANRSAYAYLNRTIEEFPNRGVLAGEIEAAGFENVKSAPMTFGAVALHEAIAPPPS